MINLFISKQTKQYIYIHIDFSDEVISLSQNNWNVYKNTYVYIYTQTHKEKYFYDKFIFI